MKVDNSFPIFGNEPTDKALTEILRQALALVDVKVLDHLVIGDAVAVSFAESGWI